MAQQGSHVGVDGGVDVQLGTEQHERDERTETGRRQTRENGDGVDRLSRLKLSSRITANVPRSENGSASAGMSVAEALWRKRQITPTTSASATSIVN